MIWHFGQTPIEPRAVVPLLGRLVHPARAVVLGGEVARGVDRVVVVVEEVPAGDVVDVAVAVGVVAVGERAGSGPGRSGWALSTAGWVA